MFSFVILLLSCALAFLCGRREQGIVDLSLRQQLATYAQRRSKARLTPLDRTFWVALSRLWPHSKEALVILEPDTVVRWHRKDFRLYWRTLSKRGPGRPPISEEIQALRALFERVRP